MALLCGERMRIAKNRNSSALAPLPSEFYARDPRAVSRGLLGKVLVRRQHRKLRTARIVEVEAYLGVNDPASHSFSGRTGRNFVLFGPPGVSYVYFIYGNHYLFNVSASPTGKLEACCSAPSSQFPESGRWRKREMSRWRRPPTCAS